MNRFDALQMRNRRAVPLAGITDGSIDDFSQGVVDSVAAGWRVVAMFGTPEGNDSTRLIAIVADDQAGRLGAVMTLVGKQYPALTPSCPQVHAFEREIAEQCGVMPEGHPWLMPLRRHRPDHAPRHSSIPVLDPDDHPFFQVTGEEVHEVAVGPVHAGIIEPGHFRFQAHGEEVLHLEIMLGYQHRGVECLLETRDRAGAVLVAESIAGDTVIGHTSAFCGAVEAVGRSRKSPRAQTIRGIALEIERLANHIGDLGSVSGDIAFQSAAAFFGRMRGECLNMLMTISGNRYGRGLIRPGGVGFDIPGAMAAELRARVERLRDELDPVAALMLDNASVQARLEGVGVVTHGACVELGFVGMVARSCGVARDVRVDHPYGVYRFTHIPLTTSSSGDVYARTLVRWHEVRRSLEFLLDQLTVIPRGEVRSAVGALQPGEITVALEEGWRGEIAHVLLTDDHGMVRRHKVVDPSFHNWRAVAEAMPGNQISDFPLCNKSFNLSYAGHDL
jgi:Ni,Fe-hydrogenase III large subunit